MFFEKILKFVRKSIISNFLEILELIRPILNVTSPYQKVFLIIKTIPRIAPLIHNNQFVVDFKEKSDWK